MNDKTLVTKAQEGDILMDGYSYAKILGRVGQIIFRTYCFIDLKECQESNIARNDLATISELENAGWKVYQEEENKLGGQND